MPANLNFSPFTSDTILFQNKEHANNFFEAITVPDATASAEGAVKKAQNVAFTPSAYANNTAITYAVIGGETVTIPTNNHLEAVKTRLEALETSYALLLVRLKSAGIVVSDS